MFSTEYTATVVKTQAQPKLAPLPAKAPALDFCLGEWRAFQNGMLCSLMGHDAAMLKTARESWSRPHRWAWDCGWNVTEKLTRRADVQLALAFRFGGLEE